ncbi:MAG TPA: SDR family oxidoreductase [Rhodothermales bacterium]|nr:SDR family oxidoreductase [Rhodothermales bacterium]
MRQQRPPPHACLVTGGANGIGKAIVQRLLEAGARVAFCDTDHEAGQATEAAYRRLGDVRFIHADVAREESVAACVGTTVDAFGRLDGLVCNAAIADPEVPPVERLTLEGWNRVLAANLTGPFLCVKHAAPHLRAAGGSVVMMASTRAHMAEPDTEAYSATKGGLLGLTHALAISLGPEVRVNAILPGWIDVRAWQHGAGKVPPLRKKDHRQHPAGRVGTPEDVAALAHFLLYGESGFITGAEFVVDGGMTRKMIYEE